MSRQICLRCCYNVATQIYHPCNHKNYCQSCSDNYIHSGLSHTPSNCPRAGCGLPVYKIEDWVRNTTLLYAPNIGYCDVPYLKHRLFIAPSGLSWIYIQTNIPQLFLNDTRIISVPISQESPFSPQFDIHRVRPETPTSDIYPVLALGQVVHRVRAHDPRREIPASPPTRRVVEDPETSSEEHGGVSEPTN
jgi:hypothetical protein